MVHQLLLELLASISFLCLINAAPLLHSALEARTTDDSACGFHGKSDIYGLGIRLGIYMQWITTLLAKMFGEPEVIRHAMDIDAIFLLAIFIGTTLLLNTSSDGISVYAVEVLVMLHISVGDFCIAWLGTASNIAKGQLSGALALRFVSNVGMSVLAVWFWFHGLYTLAETPCGSFTFLFDRLPLYGPVVIFYKVISVVFCVIFGCLLLIALVPLLILLALVPFIALAGCLFFTVGLIEGSVWGKFDRSKAKTHFRFHIVSTILRFGTTQHNLQKPKNTLNQTERSKDEVECAIRPQRTWKVSW